MVIMALIPSTPELSRIRCERFQAVRDALAAGHTTRVAVNRNLTVGLGSTILHKGLQGEFRPSTHLKNSFTFWPTNGTMGYYVKLSTILSFDFRIIKPV